MRYIAIIGTRDYPAPTILSELMKIEGENICLLTGGHTASEAGCIVAKIRGWEVCEYLPNYQRYGRGATHVRSQEMLQQADEVMSFWNGESKGTANEIKMAQKMGKRITHCGQTERKQVGGLF